MNLKVVAKAIIAFLGSGVVTAAVAAVPGFYGVIAGLVLTGLTGLITFLVPNASPTEAVEA
jgi:hypothetical protein